MVDVLEVLVGVVAALLEHQLTAPQDHDVVGAAGDRLEVVGDHHDDRALVAQPAELLERVGLVDAAARPARTYSRGMLQRLAVARALVHRPRLLLADEPFTGLDRGGVELLAALLDEEKRGGALVVVVTHDFDAVAPLVDRVIVLARGRLAHDGPGQRDGASLAAVYRSAVA